VRAPPRLADLPPGEKTPLEPLPEQSPTASEPTPSPDDGDGEAEAEAPLFGHRLVESDSPQPMSSSPFETEIHTPPATADAPASPKRRARPVRAPPPRDHLLELPVDDGPFVTSSHDAIISESAPKYPVEVPKAEPARRMVASPRRRRQASWSRTSSSPIAQDRLEIFKQRALALQPLRNLAPETYRAILDALDEDAEELGEDESAIEELTKYAKAEAHVAAAQDAAQQVFVYRDMQQGHREDMAAIDADTAAFDAETRELINHMKADHDKQKDQLHRRQQDEISAHLAVWQSPRTMAKYARPPLDLIVRRKQFETYMKNKEYDNAQMCADEIHRMERFEAQRAAAQIKVDYRESLRLLRIRQREEVAALDAKVTYERELFVSRRATDKQVFVNVRKKLDSKQRGFRDPPKAWALTRVARMNSISKPIPDEPLHPVAPAGSSRATIRSSGRFQRHTQQISLPHLDFSKF
jgi:hypothetical protein